MSAVIQQGTARGLMEFLSWVGEKGVMNPKTATAYRSAATKVLEIDGANWADLDIPGLDPNAQFERFVRLQGTKYTPESRTTYGQRFRTAVAMYLDYLADPEHFKGRPVSPPKQEKSRRRGQRGDGTEASADIPGQERLGLVNYPFPMSRGVMAYLQLPRDLAARDAQRLCAFIQSLAIDERAALLPAEDAQDK